MPTNNAPKLVTSGVIAAELGVPIHRVLRVLETRPTIQPRAYAANVRLYDLQTIARVRHELNAIDARRCRQGGQRE
jgi:predicted transcriptional regulator